MSPYCAKLSTEEEVDDLEETAECELHESTMEKIEAELQKSEGGKLRGSIGEIASSARPGTTSLNGFPGLTNKGGNMPLYDNLGRDGVRSCKAHGVQSGKDAAEVASQYVSDFQEARLIKADSISKQEKAAECLLQVAQSGLVEAPQELQCAGSVADVQDYLRSYAQLEVPLDHVEAARETLAADVLSNHVTYGFEYVPDSLEVAEYARNGIVAMPVSSSFIAGIATEIEENRDGAGDSELISGKYVTA